MPESSYVHQDSNHCPLQAKGKCCSHRLASQPGTIQGTLTSSLITIHEVLMHFKAWAGPYTRAEVYGENLIYGGVANGVRVEMSGLYMQKRS